MLNEYVDKIKNAKTDKEIRNIFECFYVQTMLNEDFRKTVEEDIEKEEDK